MSTLSGGVTHKDQINPTDATVTENLNTKTRFDDNQNNLNNPQGNNIKDLYVKSVNDVKEIRSIKHLQRTNLNLDSPLFSQSCKNLGIMKE